MNTNLPSFVGPQGINNYLNLSFVSLDFETTNLEKGSALNKDNDIVLACWTVNRDGREVKRRHIWGDELMMQPLLDDIASTDFIVAHNAKFELQWLERCGLDLYDTQVWDTMLGEWVIYGNQKIPFNLEATSQRYDLGGKTPLGAKCIKMGMPTQDIPRSWLQPYCYQDVDLATNIFYRQLDICQEKNLMHLMLVRNLTCVALAHIELQGCQLDRERVVGAYQEAIEEMAELEQKLIVMCGSINLGSSKQLGEFLFDKLGFKVPLDHKKKPMLTAKGAYKTDKATISKLKAVNKEQEEFLAAYIRFNQLDALVTKNLEFFKGVVEEYDATFYGVFNQAQTGTHRLSSSGRKLKFAGKKKESGAQLQNLPRQYKVMFTAHEDDYIIGEADGAQLEFRVAAELGNDKVAEEEIVNGADIHSVTSSVMIDAGHPDFIGKTVKQGRQIAKAHTFAPMYGGNGKLPAEQAYAEFFKKKYNGISGTQRSWCEQVVTKGWFTTPYGMRFYWPGTKMSRSGYIENTTAISNYPIQGFATGEIIPIALVCFWHRARHLDITVWNTIHDSLVSRVHKDCVEQYKELSKQCLTTDVYNFLREVYNYHFRVPLGVGVKVAKNWGASKEEHVWSVWPDGKETYELKE